VFGDFFGWWLIAFSDTIIKRKDFGKGEQLTVFVCQTAKQTRVFFFGRRSRVLHLLRLEAVFEVVEVRGLAVPLAEDDHRGVVVGVVAHVGVEELPLVERCDDLLDEGLRVGLERLHRLVVAAALLDLRNDVLEVALDVAHVRGLVEVWSPSGGCGG